MDRRQKKTRDAIFFAFGELLGRKRYENITVQEIIDTANICRSTFYTHFETKDMLLRELCADIFDHIFEGGICDYDAGSKTLEEKLSHILWHLKKIRIAPSASYHRTADIYLCAIFASISRDFLICTRPTLRLACRAISLHIISLEAFRKRLNGG